MEIWKDIEGYEGLYQVSNMGNVRSSDRTLMVKRGNDEYVLQIKGRMLRPQTRRHGYLSVWLYRLDGNKRQESVHRLVAEAFCERKSDDTEVNHKNEIKTDNRAENLEWITHKENTNYGNAQAKRSATCKRNHTNWKPIRQYDMDGNFIKEYPSLKEAGKQNGFHMGNLSRNAHGDPQYSHAHGYIWKYVT